jgi:hypothetical protein
MMGEAVEFFSRNIGGLGNRFFTRPPLCAIEEHGQGAAAAKKEKKLCSSQQVGGRGVKGRVGETGI